jgi:hypothetical protein
MTRHLRSCLAAESSRSPKGRKKDAWLHLIVEDEGRGDYWLHLEAHASSSLVDLDCALRDIWLECCGHMSVFTIGCDHFTSMASSDFDDSDMGVQLTEVVSVGTTFTYKYDMGTTTYLKLRALGERAGPSPKTQVRLLARNDPLPITCACGEPARYVCSSCSWKLEGYMCESCKKSHACGAELLLPVVNSPRVGQCAYTGGSS